LKFGLVTTHSQRRLLLFLDALLEHLEGPEIMIEIAEILSLWWQLGGNF
jgi:hypothetical protein